MNPFVNVQHMPERSNLRILVVAAAHSERECLCASIDGFRDCLLVGAPSDANSILRVAVQTRPDVAIIDCSDFDAIALGLCRLLMHNSANTQILLHTDRTSRVWITDALREGVRAVVLKSGSHGHLLPALDALADHRPYWEGAFDDELLDELLE